MGNYTPNGSVLPAAISVLPSTAAIAIFPQLNMTSIASTVAAFAGLWLVSYVGTSLILKQIKK